jgi:magnesium transporter
MRREVEYNGLKWVDIVGPKEADVLYLKETFGLHPITLENIVPSVAHPALDVFQDYVSMTLHYPRNVKGGDVEIYELDIIVGKKFIITNSYRPIRPVRSVFESCFGQESFRQEYMDKGSEYLAIVILDKFLKRLLEKIDHINYDVSSIEKKIFTEKERKVIEKISYLKRRIITFWRAIDPQREVFYSLKTLNNDFFGKEYKPNISQLFRTYAKVDNYLKTLKDTVESLEETNHSIVNIRRNETMKILTIFSVILMPLTLLASMWGMNTTLLPFRGFSFDFWIIVAVMAALSGVMLWWFKLRKWL